MHVLITGITGFVGHHLAERLLAAGMRVSGLAADRSCALADVDFKRLDILDEDALAAAVDLFDADVVVHLAGLSHVGESWRRPGDYLRVNFEGTRHLLRAAAGRRIIFASSSEVYGHVPSADQPIVEDRPLEPVSPYAITKACAERVARDHGAMVVRSFNAIGAGQTRQFALPSFAAQLAAIGRGEKEPVLRVGNLKPRRDFLHVADAAAGYQTLIESGEPGAVYNLASGVAYSIGEALERLRAASGVDAEIRVDETRLRKGDIPLLQGSPERLQRLGWRPEHSLGEALEDLWQAEKDRVD